MVFPPLNQNANPPPPASVATNARRRRAERRQWHACRTTSRARSRRLTVRGDQADSAAVPRLAGAARRHAKPAAPTRRQLPPAPRRRAANAAPCRQCAAVAVAAGRSGRRLRRLRPEPRTRVAANHADPDRAAPAAAPRRAAAIWCRSPRSGTRPTHRPPSGPCRASSRRVLGSHAPVIKRADLGEKGVYYRAMVGPFGSSEEASQFCGSLKRAGGQCVIQRN